MYAAYRKYQKNGGNHYEEFDRAGIYFRQKWIDERA